MSDKIDDYWPLLAENSFFSMIIDPLYKLDKIDTKN